jgi:hypothetical protein
MTIVFAYADTGFGHKSTAEGLESLLPTVVYDRGHLLKVEHINIYSACGVTILGGAGRLYSLLCRYAIWLYNFLFTFSDRASVKQAVARIIVSVYGRRIERAIARLDPDLILVLHPLFFADVFTLMRKRSHSRWKVASLVTDLGNAHSGWACPWLDLAFFVSPEQIENLRAKGCLGQDTKVFLTRAPVRSPFKESVGPLDIIRLSAFGIDRPYVLYIPGLMPRRVVAFQLDRLVQEYVNLQIVVAGPGPRQSLSRRKDAGHRILYMPMLSANEMAIVMRNAHLVSGKAGPAVMAESASTRTIFLPTAEVGRQEVGNCHMGRILYGVKLPPSWSWMSAKRPELPKSFPTNADRVGPQAEQVWDILLAEIAGNDIRSERPDH